jgi:hypothetical protein
MTPISKHVAEIPNPALQPFSVLIGEWETTGQHHLMPGVTLHGRATFEWLEGGAFMLWRSEIDEPGIPSGLAVFGSDDATGEFFMAYFDERGISRKYEMSMDGNVWKYWRNSPGFFQRYTGTIVDNNRTIIGKGELSRDGKTWEGDLDLTYTRVERAGSV